MAVALGRAAARRLPVRYCGLPHRAVGQAERRLCQDQHQDGEGAREADPCHGSPDCGYGYAHSAPL